MRDIYRRTAIKKEIDGDLHKDRQKKMQRGRVKDLNTYACTAIKIKEKGIEGWRERE